MPNLAISNAAEDSDSLNPQSLDATLSGAVRTEAAFNSILLSHNSGQAREGFPE